MSSATFSDCGARCGEAARSENISTRFRAFSWMTTGLSVQDILLFSQIGETKVCPAYTEVPTGPKVNAEQFGSATRIQNNLRHYSKCCKFEVLSLCDLDADWCEVLPGAYTNSVNSKHIRLGVNVHCRLIRLDVAAVTQNYKVANPRIRQA